MSDVYLDLEVDGKGNGRRQGKEMNARCEIERTSGMYDLFHVVGRQPRLQLCRLHEDPHPSALYPEPSGTDVLCCIVKRQKDDLIAVE